MNWNLRVFIEFLIQHLCQCRHNCGVFGFLLKHRSERLGLLEIAFLSNFVKHLREYALGEELKVRCPCVLGEFFITYKLIKQGCYDNLVCLGELSAVAQVYLSMTFSSGSFFSGTGLLP